MVNDMTKDEVKAVFEKLKSLDNFDLDYNILNELIIDGHTILTDEEIAENIRKYDWYAKYAEADREASKLLTEVGYKHVEQDGGGEGGTEYCYTIFKMGNKLWRIEYRYYSYDGFNLDYAIGTITEVEPKPVQRTEYVVKN